MSSQIDIKKKLILKSKKPIHKTIQLSQNNKKNIKILDHDPKIFQNINNNNSIKTIQKLEEDLNSYKNKCQKLDEEIIKLNFKIKEISEKNEKFAKKSEEEKNSEEDNSSSFSSQKKSPLKKAIISAYNILIELVELILNQKTYKDKDNNLTPKQNENISMDIYEPSVYNDEERKSLLFEHIQQILIFKINFVNKMII